MTLLGWYLLSSVVCILALAVAGWWTVKKEKKDLTIGDIGVAILVSLIPGINIAITMGALGCLWDTWSKITVFNGAE